MFIKAMKISFQEKCEQLLRNKNMIFIVNNLGHWGHLCCILDLPESYEDRISPHLPIYIWLCKHWVKYSKHMTSHIMSLRNVTLCLIISLKIYFCSFSNLYWQIYYSYYCFTQTFKPPSTVLFGIPKFTTVSTSWMNISLNSGFEWCLADSEDSISHSVCSTDVSFYFTVLVPKLYLYPPD